MTKATSHVLAGRSTQLLPAHTRTRTIECSQRAANHGRLGVVGPRAEPAGRISPFAIDSFGSLQNPMAILPGR